MTSAVSIAIPRIVPTIALYAEAASDWAYLGPVVELLAGAGREHVAYLTSDRTDPLLRDPPRSVTVYFVGSGASRTYMFETMGASVLVLTMPDLESFHLKRSRLAPVHYVYAFHSIVSTHMAYRPGAFDAYDTVLAVGEHHVREIRAT